VSREALGREGKITGVQARQHMCQNKNIRRPRVCVDRWWNAIGPHFPPVQVQAQVQVLHAGGRVARRRLRGADASPSFRPDNSDNTDDTDVRRARGSKQAAGGRRAAGSQACAQQSERTRLLLPAGIEGSWQLAAGTRRWELGGGRGSAGRRLAIVTQTGYALSSPLSLQARRYPARTWRRPALLRHAQSVHGASVITY
jgi:hypothetical protein